MSFLSQKKIPRHITTEYYKSLSYKIQKKKITIIISKQLKTQKKNKKRKKKISCINSSSY